MHISIKLHQFRRLFSFFCAYRQTYRHLHTHGQSTAPYSATF